jgi:hypothetical protein
VPEETGKAGSGSEGNGAGIDHAAVALALHGATREDAHEFLKKQGHLVDRRLRSTNGWSQHSANLWCEFFQMF